MDNLGSNVSIQDAKELLEMNLISELEYIKFLAAKVSMVEDINKNCEHDNITLLRLTREYEAKIAAAVKEENDKSESKPDYASSSINLADLPVSGGKGYGGYGGVDYSDYGPISGGKG